MALQRQAYLVPALGKQGYESRQDPICQGSPYIAEGEDIVAGGFVFQGTNENQAKGIATANTEPLGVAVYQQYQIGFAPATKINNGEVIKVDYRGCVFCKPLINVAKVGQKVLIDPTTGALQASDNDTSVATAGQLEFKVVKDAAEWKSTTAGKLSLIIDGTQQDLTNLDFSSVTDLASIATVLNTALTSKNGSCSATSTGLVIKSKTTGSESTVRFKPVDGDISDLLQVKLLGNIQATDGANAFIDTKWTIKTGNDAGQVVEITRI